MPRYQHKNTGKADAALAAFYARHGITPAPLTAGVRIEMATNGCLVQWGDAPDDGVFISAKEGRKLIADLGDVEQID